MRLWLVFLVVGGGRGNLQGYSLPLVYVLASHAQRSGLWPAGPTIRRPTCLPPTPTPTPTPQL